MKHIILSILFFLFAGHIHAQTPAFDSLAKRSDFLITGIVIDNFPKMQTKDAGTWQGYCRIKIKDVSQMVNTSLWPKCTPRINDTLSLWYETYEQRSSASQMIAQGKKLSFLVRIDHECRDEVTLTDKAEAVFQFTDKVLEETFRWSYSWMSDTALSKDPSVLFRETTTRRPIAIHHTKKDHVGNSMAKRKKLMISFNATVRILHDEQGRLQQRTIIFRRAFRNVIKVYDTNGKVVKISVKRRMRVNF